MFERFTERARHVVVLAQREARALRHTHIGTEHLLLGLLSEEEGIAARVLESLDITVEEVRAKVARLVPAADEATTGTVPFTPRAKKVLDLALREALALGQKHIGTEHVLLGLARLNEGAAARVLIDFDADAETLRTETLRAMSRSGQARPSGPLPAAWEYELLTLGDPASLTVESLNARGAVGWEVVGVVGAPGDQRLILKRPKRSA